jgi:alkanesulfonate monooxygenase SsuD/methylene tetrahydromethanopterin reductase-like flavin-dependent oxidoreductase (luciferase family)
MIDAYMEALPEGREPRILASRTVFVADDGEEARRLAEIGLGRHRARLARLGRSTGDGSGLNAMIAAMDVHLGTPDTVIASLKTDSTLARSTDLAVQVHSIDPPHPSSSDHRAGRRGRGARARLGSECRASPVSRDKSRR